MAEVVRATNSSFDFASAVLVGILREVDGRTDPDDEGEFADTGQRAHGGGGGALEESDGGNTRITEGTSASREEPCTIEAETVALHDEGDQSPLTSLPSSAEPSPSGSPLRIPMQLALPEAPTECSAEPHPPPLTRLGKRKIRSKAASRRNRQKKKDGKDLYEAKPALSSCQFKEAGQSSTSYDAELFSISDAGYIALRSRDSSKIYGLDELVGPKSKFKFPLKVWEGKKPLLVFDAKDRLVAVCAGVPRNDEGWQTLQLRAADILEGARSQLVFEKKQKNHRRGKFPAINIGISHGGGQPYPKMLEQNAKNKEILQSVLGDESFERISGFATGAFATWAPELYKYQNRYIDALLDKDQELRMLNKHPHPEQEKLRRNWPKTPWAATALNFGPKTVCAKHADYGNLAFGWCAITALGRYNYKKGGHAVLWNLRLVIEFPPGATIFIPSSAIEHSNARIQDGETRYSVTQYSSGGIFRWVDNDFQTVDVHRSQMTPDETASLLEKLSQQLDFGLSLYSTLDELVERGSVTAETPIIK